MLSSLTLNQGCVSSHLKTNIQGISILFNDHNLEAMTDMVKIRKIYKLSPSKMTGTRKNTGLASTNGVIAAGQIMSEHEVTALGLMALRGAS